MRGRFFTSALCGAASLAMASEGCDRPAPASERTCSGALAISAADLRGWGLPQKTLALTFDDGPGQRTAELSSYLQAQGIRAAFFVNGKMFGPQSAALLQQLVADGHIVGNHTQTHTSITGRSTGSGHLSDSQVVTELAQTDDLIAPVVFANRFIFRAPFGDYDEVASFAINGSAMKKYVGPINWDIGDHMGPNQATDWDCWQPGSDGLVLTVAQCGDLYLEEIDTVGHGIVLMHDPYFIDGDPSKGGTVDMVKNMVPVLKTKGYKFARLDEVPEVAELLPPLPVPDAGADSSGGGLGSLGSPSDRTGSGPIQTAAPKGGQPQSRTAPSGGKPDPCPASPQQIRAN